MAEFHEPSVASDAPTRDEEQPEPLTFTLQVVSPSVGVSMPLSFPHLPAKTSIKELKAKIRDVLPSKPSDENQRLIHRGRMLGNEAETMVDVFGRETLENPQPQTLHLVLRPTAADGPSAQPAVPTPGLPPFSGLPNLPQPRPQPTLTQPVPAVNVRQTLPTAFQDMHNLHNLHQLGDNTHAITQRIQHLHREAQRLHQEMGTIEQRYRAAVAGNGQNSPHNQLPRIGHPHIPMPPSVQALIAQQQRERAAHGRQGVQDGHGFPLHFGVPTASGRSSPAPPGHTATYVQQGVGPTGDTWRTTMTVNETRTTFTVPGGGHQHGPSHGNATDGGHYNPVPDLMAHMHAHARAASRPPSRVASQVPGNMERSASSTSFGNPPAFVGNATPGTNTPTSSQSAFANGLPTLPIVATPTPQPHIFSSPSTPTVYILSSPSGPRALLVTGQNNAFLGAYQQGQNQELVQRPPITLPEFRNRHAARGGRRQAPEEQAAVPPILGAHANPQAGAVAAGLPRIAWLLVRLIGVIWFFSSSNHSWGRWFLTTGLAVLVFLFNTGIFNGVINDLWAPIRGHIENIIPLAGPDAALIPAANAAPIPQVGAPPPGTEPLRTGPNGELDPQQVANRILAQRRGQQGWLRAQIRRVEHSLLLFLASLIPGVGERHIAAREAEANERQRQIDAAAAAAEAASNPEGGNGDGAQPEGGAIEGEPQPGDMENIDRQGDEAAPLLNRVAV